MARTVLYDEHVNLKAKMVPFAGWDMPVSYKGILEEHKCVRENVGIFDVSHMGEVFVSGKDALSFLQSLVPQDISKLELNKAIYCQLLNDKAGVIDDLIIYKLEDEKYLSIINASRVENDLNQLNSKAVDFDVTVDNQTNNYSLLAVQGPSAYSLMKKMGFNHDIKYFSILKTEMLGSDVYVSRTGYTGEDGFEVMIKNEDAKKFWQEFLSRGEEFLIQPIGLGARDTLRLEAGLHLFGNDLDEETTPVESGLSWSISKTKKENYTGREVIMSQLGLENPEKYPKKRKLIGFIMTDNAIARHGYEIYSNNNKVGVVTSGSIAPTLGKNIGLGYIELLDNSLTSLNNTSITIGTEIQIMVRNKLYNAKVVKRPFVEKNVKSN